MLGALPPVRARIHNLFELTHRFGGWTWIAVFWALTLHLTQDHLGAWQVKVLGAHHGQHRLALAELAPGASDD